MPCRLVICYRCDFIKDTVQTLNLTVSLSLLYNTATLSREAAGSVEVDFR